MSSAVVFDLDGTLVDSRPGIDWALLRALAEVAPEVELQTMSPFIGPPLAEMLGRALPGLGEARRAEVGARFRALYDEQGWRRTELFPGVSELLAELAARGVPAHVVTNKPARPTAAVLGLPGLAGRIASACSPDSAEGPHRDKPAMLLATLDAQHLVADRVVVVGDDGDDRRAARAAGCGFIAVAYGYGDAARTSSPADLGCAGSAADVERILGDWLAC